MTVEAILWDNDGVLVDTEPIFLRANREILAEIGIRVDDTQFRDINLTRGRSVLELALDHGYCTDDVLAMRARRDARYGELLDAGVDVLSGVPETLTELHGRLPMGIVTSSQRDHFDRIHRQTDLLRYFEFTVANGDYERHKPHPDAYLVGAERIGVPPERCLAVEDTERGVRAAVAAGMRCIVIPRPLSRDGDFSVAHRVLASAREVVAEVEALVGR